MGFKSKALAVVFLTLIASSQAYSVTSQPGVPSDKQNLVMVSSFIETNGVSSITGVGQIYGTSAGSLSDGALANAGNSLTFPVHKDAQASVELKNGEIVIADATVPEPESYAMFLAGLGIIAAMVRRRSTSV